jgi:pyruvate dehydrogenase E2 component (dihydrolipoamide acetyltransferase)
LNVDLSTLRGSGIDGAITRADVEKAKNVQKAVSGKKLASSPTRLRVSPFARRIAAELGVDLHAVHGTGPDGAITKADVEKAATIATPSPAPAEAPPKAARPAHAPTTDKHAAMRRAIAAAMSRSKREIPHYYLGTRIDMSKALAWLEAENLQRSVSERLLYSVLLLKAVALVIHDVPEMNGFWAENAFQASEAIHLGVAISLRQGGLIAPAIHDVDKKTLDELMRDLKDLVKRTRAGVLRSSEISDSTITVTSLGEQGVETVFGVIYPPQVALVGFGKITQQPWATDGMLGARAVIHASLAADHRASDGHRGGRFLAAIDRLLQEPEKL